MEAQMTGYERIMTTLDGGAADRVPLMLHSFMPAAAEAGLSMGQYRSSAQNIARCHIDFARKYGLDGILLDVDTCILAGAVGVPIDLPDDAPARRTHQATAASVQEMMALMSPERVGQNERVNIVLEAVRLMKNEAGGELLIRGNCDQMAFSLAMLSYGMNDFLADLADEDMEADILALIDRAYYVHLEYHKLMAQAGADITSFGDSSCGPALISRAMFRKYSLPFHQRLRADLKGRGIKTVCHICGNLDAIIDDVAAIGYEGVEIDYKTDIPNAARAFRGKSTVFGPIDPSGTFFFGTPETMRADVTRVLDAFAATGIVLGAGCAIPTGAPEANLRAFVSASREYTRTA
jgi:MtaA/CmuA family methyltransferase